MEWWLSVCLIELDSNTPCITSAKWKTLLKSNHMRNHMQQPNDRQHVARPLCDDGLTFGSRPATSSAVLMEAMGVASQVVEIVPAHM